MLVISVMRRQRIALYLFLQAGDLQDKLNPNSHLCYISIDWKKKNVPGADEAVVMAQVTGFVLPILETWIEFPAPSSGPALAIAGIWGVSQCMDRFSLCTSQFKNKN